tara:strand:- start:4035 stop:4724 length:690 start_codon:yes stop_codon:yes gene_type:complete
MSKSILVIAAHPDDEVLGCGGSILRHSQEGDKVYVVIAAEGLTSRQKKRNRDSVSRELDDLIISANKAAEILEVSGIDFLELPDNRLDSLDRLDLIKLIEEKIRKYQPEIVYTHHSGDVNVDHRRLYEATITSCRPMPGNTVKRILTYEVLSSTDWQPKGAYDYFQPNVFIDISSQFQKKMQALNIYSSEMREWPHSRSIKAVEHLARLRGSQVGKEAVEAFNLIREID